MIANILEVVAASLNDFGKEKHGGVQKKGGDVIIKIIKMNNTHRFSAGVRIYIWNGKYINDLQL